MRVGKFTSGIIGFIEAVLLLFSFAPLAGASSEGSDAEAWRVSTSWWFIRPAASFSGWSGPATTDLSQKFGSIDYTTFSGRVEWKLAPRHHITLQVNPVSFTRSMTVPRAVELRAASFSATIMLPVQESADVHVASYAPGYRYDFLRGRLGYLALATQVDMMKTDLKFAAHATFLGFTGSQAYHRSTFSALPVVGPRGKWYPLPHSQRQSLEGSVRGMYYFDYGDIVATDGIVGVGVTRHLRLNAGYQMGTRTNIHATEDRIGMRLTQKGVIAGIETYW